MQGGLVTGTIQAGTRLGRLVPIGPAKLWMQYIHSQNTSSVAADAETRDHFLFVTLEQDSYNELEAVFPGTAILEKAFAWSSRLSNSTVFADCCETA